MLLWLLLFVRPSNWPFGLSFFRWLDMIVNGISWVGDGKWRWQVRYLCRGIQKSLLDPYADGASLSVGRGIAYPVAHMGDSQRVAELPFSIPVEFLNKFAESVFCLASETDTVKIILSWKMDKTGGWEGGGKRRMKWNGSIQWIECPLNSLWISGHNGKLLKCWFIASFMWVYYSPESRITLSAMATFKEIYLPLQTAPNRLFWRLRTATETNLAAEKDVETVNPLQLPRLPHRGPILHRHEKAGLEVSGGGIFYDVGRGRAWEWAVSDGESEKHLFMSGGVHMEVRVCSYGCGSLA